MLNLLLAGFAGHRAARAVAVDDITEHWRTSLVIWSIHHEASDAQVKRRTFFADLVTCPHCVGFWLTATAVLALATGNRWLRLAVTIWAAAGVQALLTSAETRLDGIPAVGESQTD